MWPYFVKKNFEHRIFTPGGHISNLGAKLNPASVSRPFESSVNYTMSNVLIGWETFDWFITLALVLHPDDSHRGHLLGLILVSFQRTAKRFHCLANPDLGLDLDRVARFFQNEKIYNQLPHNLQNGDKIHQMAFKMSKWPKNIPQFSISRP
jgi:hypothetical protein